MEIERKYLVKQIPENYKSFPCHAIEQAYLCTGPVVRARREDGSYCLTYKGKGLLSKGEYSLPLNEQTYRHLPAKADGIMFTRKRYLIPMEGADHLTIKMDVFENSYQGLVLAEVEFPAEEEAMAFKAPEWFGRDATFFGEFQNSRLTYRDIDIPYKQV